MADISIGKTSNNLSQNVSAKGEFAALKQEYKSFKKKAAKSDMSNSKTIKEKELELLKKLSILAKKESLQKEQEWIDSNINEILKSLSTEESKKQSAYYKPISFSGQQSIQGRQPDTANIDVVAKILEPYKKADGTIDDNIRKIVSAFDSSGSEIYFIEYLLKHFCDEEGHISSDVSNSIEILAKSDISPNMIPQALEVISQKDSTGKNVFDVSICNQISKFKEANFDDFESLKLAKFLNSDFEDVKKVEAQIYKMKKAGITPDAIINILNALAIKPTEQNKKTISDSAVNSIISLKKALSSTRNNEKSERNNPINQLGVVTFSVGNDVIIMKGNKVTYISPIEGQSVHNLKKEYDDLITKLEENLLLEFAKKYKNSNGEIDSKYLRVISSLRNKGITYDQLINMTDFCIDNGSIDINKLNAISKIKSSGALGIDVIPILSSIKRTEDGSYNQEDLENACALSSAVIGGNEVIALLPEVKSNKELKEVVIYFSQFFEDKSNLIKLLPLIKDKSGHIDENAINILYNFADNFLTQTSSKENETKFLEYSKAILLEATNKLENKIKDEVADMCSSLCKNGNSPEEILLILKKCKSSSGDIDNKLSEIILNFSSDDVQFQDIENIIDFCKTKMGEIDQIKVDSILSLFEKGYSNEEIINYIKNID